MATTVCKTDNAERTHMTPLVTGKPINHFWQMKIVVSVMKIVVSVRPSRTIAYINAVPAVRIQPR